MSKKNKITRNYLDFTFRHNPELKWECDEDGKVTLFQENKGIVNKLAQKIIKKPAVSQIHLEGPGNLIWTLIDGKRTVYEIGQIVEEKMGEEAAPVYERLCVYMDQLKSYNFIEQV